MSKSGSGSLTFYLDYYPTTNNFTQSFTSTIKYLEFNVDAYVGTSTTYKASYYYIPGKVSAGTQKPSNANSPTNEVSVNLTVTHYYQSFLMSSTSIESVTGSLPSNTSSVKWYLSIGSDLKSVSFVGNDNYTGNCASYGATVSYNTSTLTFNIYY